MMSSCCTLRLNRRNALSRVSPSWIMTSAIFNHLLPGRNGVFRRNPQDTSAGGARGGALPAAFALEDFLEAFFGNGEADASGRAAGRHLQGVKDLQSAIVDAILA